MSESGAMVLLAGALVARAGQLLLASSAGRAKFAATATVRGMLDLAVVTLTVVLCARLGWQIIPTTLALPLAGALAGGGLLAAMVGERATMPVGAVMSLLYAGLVLPLAWRLVPSLTDRGLIDQGGASLLFLPAGVIGVVAAVVVGPRAGKFARDGSVAIIPAHQLPMVFVGLMLLVAGWSATVSQIAGDAAWIMLTLALSAGIVGGLIYPRLRFGRVDPMLIVPASIGAILAATVGIGHWVDWQCILTALLGALAGVHLHLWLERRLKVDDLTGTAAGMIAGPAVGLLAAAAAVAPGMGLKPWLEQLLVQAYGGAVFAGIALAAGVAGLLLLRMVVRVRVPESAEYEGLDLSVHDVNAYPDFSQPMIRSYHSREV